MPAEIQARIFRNDIKNWLKALLAQELLTGPINTFADFFEHSQLDHLGPMADVLYP